MDDGLIPKITKPITLDKKNADHKVFKEESPDITNKNALIRRISRNESEKYRRDRLNMCIGQLGKLVPCPGGKKIDKSGILRLAVNFLKIRHDIGVEKHYFGWKPSFISPILSEKLHDLVDGCLVCVSSKGDIIYTSKRITTTYGHDLYDMLGSSFFSIVHKDDHSLLKHQITDEKNVPLARGDRREFFLRILDSKNKQYPWYQFCHVNGFVRKIPFNSNENDKCENCYIFILRGLINLTTSMIYTPFMESSRCQWYCRHSVDGRILQTDSKINWISGFMSNEVLNSSPYFFLHHLDIDFLIGIHNTFLITGCAPKFVTRFYDKSLKILYVLTELKYIDAGQSYQIISMNQLLSVNEGTYMWEKQQRCINRYNSSKINNNSKFVKNSVFLRDNILTVITNQREYQMKVHGHCPYIKLKYTEPTFLTSDCTSNILPSSVPMKSELKFSTRKNYQLPFTSDYKEKENKDFENKWAKYYTSKHLLTLKNIQKKLVTPLVETSNVYPSNCNFLSNICTQSDNNKSICNLLFRQIDKNIEKPLVDSRIQCSKSVSNKQ